MSTPPERIAARIRERREELHLSQETLARSLGITLRAEGRWERCESFGFLKRLPEIAKALSTTESDLLQGEDPVVPQITNQQVSEKLDRVLSELAELRADLRPMPRRRASS